MWFNRGTLTERVIKHGIARLNQLYVVAEFYRGYGREAYDEFLKEYSEIKQKVRKLTTRVTKVKDSKKLLERLQKAGLEEALEWEPQPF
jgi:phosphoglycolate phosphatase-like HAD superfamily hydrolase